MSEDTPRYEAGPEPPARFVHTTFGELPDGAVFCWTHTDDPIPCDKKVSGNVEGKWFSGRRIKSLDGRAVTQIINANTPSARTNSIKVKLEYAEGGWMPSGQWMASLIGERDKWATGNDPRSAIGNLVAWWPELFNIELSGDTEESIKADNDK